MLAERGFRACTVTVRGEFGQRGAKMGMTQCVSAALHSQIFARSIRRFGGCQGFEAILSGEGE
jgi:hypothetical protein